jgi:hypothetical protein
LHVVAAIFAGLSYFNTDRTQRPERIILAVLVVALALR